MAWIYCKCGQGLDKPTPRQVLMKNYTCPVCGADNNGHMSEGEAVIELFDSLAPAAPVTLRDQFAMAALQGLLSTAGAPCLHGLDGIEPTTATAAYKIADAMLEARK